MTRKKIIWVTSAAIMVCIIAAVSLISVYTPDTLDLYDADTGRLYGSWEAVDGLEFSVEFVHSVNKSPVRDYFVLAEGEIYAERTDYDGFGAGVQTEIEEGQTLTYDADGTMIVTGFHQHFPQVRYIVGTVSDHTLHIGEETISLRELCGRNAAVVFEVRSGIFHW